MGSSVSSISGSGSTGGASDCILHLTFKTGKPWLLLCLEEEAQKSIQAALWEVLETGRPSEDKPSGSSEHMGTQDRVLPTNQVTPFFRPIPVGREWSTPGLKDPNANDSAGKDLLSQGSLSSPPNSAATLAIPIGLQDLPVFQSVSNTLRDAHLKFANPQYQTESRRQSSWQLEFGK
ncbi:unnamed protein product [Protopolystoma xenopodis]|uniref:Uncharacterized protein n=1 Tax=Protopolystoma xenopodis TaxID=117903 RepID=A0A3S5CL73_9PLAT|nr:unnamed protein product [Protopolystoma xenopodis]